MFLLETPLREFLLKAHDHLVGSDFLRLAAITERIPFGFLSFASQAPQMC